jgi:hypothetical protein
VLFPGSSLAADVMAFADGRGQARDHRLARPAMARDGSVWRLTLAEIVAGLAVINATGVYAQLVAAHAGERGPATSALDVQDAALAARVEVAAHTVGDLDRRPGQIDLTIEEAAKRGRTMTALTAIEAARKTREVLAAQRQREGKTFRTSKPSAPP